MRRLLKSKIVIVLITLFTAGLIIAQTIKYPEFQSIKKFKIVSFHDGICNVNADFEIFNNNWFSVQGNSIHSEVYYKGRLIAIGSNDQKVKLPKNDVSLISMNIDFFLDSLTEDLRELFMKDSIELSVKVSGKFSFLNIKKEMDFPITISSGEFAENMIGDLMNKEGIKTEFLKLKDVGIEYSYFDVGFRIQNKLPFDLTVKEIRSPIFADRALSQKVADWLIISGVEIESGNSQVIKGEAMIHNAKSAFTGLIKVVSGNLDYYMNGYALVQIEDREIRIPLRQHFKVKPLSREVEIIN
jgi:LEA14-like dessication related protein